MNWRVDGTAMGTLVKTGDKEMGRAIWRDLRSEFWRTVWDVIANLNDPVYLKYRYWTKWGAVYEMDYGDGPNYPPPGTGTDTKYRVKWYG
ncbi:MAG: hypothetical protein ABIJ75_04925 [Actinomycetota bacterium]